jgi:tRNA (guanine-N7-)-methyltransferase
MQESVLPKHRGIRSFVVRTGRMGSGQARALQTLGPQFVVPYEASPLVTTTLFGREAPVILEIGFGMGDATAQIAQNQPEFDFLGLEVHPPGIGSLLQRIEEKNLTNVRIIDHDAVQVLEHMLVPESLAGVHIFFPDPWHKKKHHKRRLIQAPFVAQLTSRLQNGAYLHCATDWQDYAEQMRDVLGACSALRLARPNEVKVRPSTKFEKRGLRLGHGVWDFVFIKQEP